MDAAAYRAENGGELAAAMFPDQDLDALIAAYQAQRLADGYPAGAEPSFVYMRALRLAAVNARITPVQESVDNGTYSVTHRNSVEYYEARADYWEDEFRRVSGLPAVQRPGALRRSRVSSMRTSF